MGNTCAIWKQRVLFSNTRKVNEAPSLMVKCLPWPTTLKKSCIFIAWDQVTEIWPTPLLRSLIAWPDLWQCSKELVSAGAIVVGSVWLGLPTKPTLGYGHGFCSVLSGFNSRPMPSTMEPAIQSFTEISTFSEGNVSNICLPDIMVWYCWRTRTSIPLLSLVAVVWLDRVAHIFSEVHFCMKQTRPNPLLHKNLYVWWFCKTCCLSLHRIVL